jgi:general secretion pathway protein G
MTKKGFTLIELLVVISIIGILTTLVMVNLNAARERARDTQRKSDLSNIQTALRLYYNDYGSFPESDIENEIQGCGTPAGTDVCEWGFEWAAGGTTYMKILPQDPLGSEAGYKYTEDSANDSYLLQACLENKSDAKGVASAACSSGFIYQVSP